MAAGLMPKISHLGAAFSIFSLAGRGRFAWHHNPSYQDAIHLIASLLQLAFGIGEMRGKDGQHTFLAEAFLTDSKRQHAFEALAISRLIPAALAIPSEYP